MTTTDTINTGSVYGHSVADVAGGNVWSAETMMLYITMKLNEVDTRFNELMGVQEESLAKQEYLNEVQNYVSKYNEMHEHYDGDYTQWAEHSAANLPPFPVPPPGLEEFGNQLIQEWNAANVPSMEKAERAGQIEVFESRLKQIGDEISGDSQLLMIELQKVMNERQAAITMCTNLVAADGDCNDGIVKNIR